MGKNLKGKEIGKGIYQRKNGLYEARVSTKNGKTISFYDTNVKRLKKKRDSYMEGFAAGNPGYELSMTVDKWYDNWMELYVAPTKKSTTIRNYVCGYERIRDYMGFRKLIEVKPVHIQNMINGMRETGYANTSIIHSLTILKLMFEKAFFSKMIPVNPFDGIVLPREDPDSVRKEAECLSEEETALFLDTCKGTRYYELFFILLHTGLRIGEACALEWKDVNLEKNFLSVSKTLNRGALYYDASGQKLEKPVNATQITSPKRKASYRIVPFTDAVHDCFLSWKAKQEKDKERTGWGSKNALLKEYPGLIFTTRTGTCYLPADAQNEATRISRVANAKEESLAEEENRTAIKLHVHPHLLRHTFITRCRQSGMNPATVQTIAGHSNLQMTDYYTHIEDSHIMSEYQRYAKVYGKNTD